MTDPSGSDKPRRPVVVPALALLAVTALGITSLLGGLNEAPDAPPGLGKGALLDQGRYSTRFVGSRVRVEPATSQLGEDRRFVELVFEVTNRGDETTPVGLPPSRPEHAAFGATFASSLVKISPAFPPDSGPFVFAVAKGGETGQLHPGVRSTVIVRYRLKDGEQPPDKVTLDVSEFEYTAGFNDTSERWQKVTAEEDGKLVPEIKARVTLPVEGGASA
ncbi:hypothetical protein [Nonomuraea lactucae]|uniref:hypothetical protein n=1 Tax=Nonomuraea lactucae TaxID=2249762 RepID=UPI000DE40EC8|nr:hypothetical protein [Nonomuraea lactucae]